MTDESESGAAPLKKEWNYSAARPYMMLYFALLSIYVGVYDNCERGLASGERRKRARKWHFPASVVTSSNFHTVKSMLRFCSLSSVTQTPRTRGKQTAPSGVRSVALFICALAMAQSSCGVHDASPLRTEHEIKWRGMQVEVGPEFTLRDDDTALLARHFPVTKNSVPEVLVFKWADSTGAASFVNLKTQCMGDTACHVEMDSVVRIVFECISWQHGAVADSSFSTARRCIVHGRRIEARYSCRNLVCDRFSKIMLQSFATLSESKPDTVGEQ